ncbi:hypothetical protein CAOG_01724 [Capsaspora owczarzaki ATCC 30864]|uniref:hypothetical protein n=1 Tax=Capsaspora owczarzaki (strain ATCC 30864) TaxID=595528 RepID=UPI0001FE326F|nr:hypothetical protein CAOG_01724 [Capsaspora owczarzaki ATCC 30864]|eukprot:XP_004364592.1 hypothetical protein CAOG_01724 [Capsaspora owczarzaki ATCC 30864]
MLHMLIVGRKCEEMLVAIFLQRARICKLETVRNHLCHHVDGGLCQAKLDECCSILVCYEATLVDSAIELLTESTPIMHDMREGWEVRVLPTKYCDDVVYESLYVGYVER